MDIVRTYGNTIKKSIIDKKPEMALNLIKTGLNYTYRKLSLRPEKAYPPSLQYLDKLCVKFILDGLKNPKRTCWVNLFAPCEIIHAFNLNPLFIEGFSSFLTGFKCEDFFLDMSEASGISNTLCSYHRGFIGAGECEMLPKPLFSTASSIICDGNINTFRYLSKKYDIPYYVIDIPYYYSDYNINYVISQLHELVEMIENLTGTAFNEDKLKEILEIENQTKLYMHDYLNSLSNSYFPNTLTMEMYKLFATHVFMGREETLNFFKMLSTDIQDKKYILPNEKETTRVFWVHLIPFYHRVLRNYFNLSTKYQLLGIDLNFDYMEYMDVDKPFESIAKKMILNSYNGSFNRKTDLIIKMVDKLKADAVINFCHFGCKQSSGGLMLLKSSLDEKNIPFLSIDGDGVDKRSAHEGQVSTRIEAFFEMIEKGGK